MSTPATLIWVLILLAVLVVLGMLLVKAIMVIASFLMKWWFPILVTIIFLTTAVFVNLDTAWPVPLLGGAIAAGWKIYHKLF